MTWVQRLCRLSSYFNVDGGTPGHDDENPFPTYTSTTGLTGAPVAPRILVARRIRQAA